MKTLELITDLLNAANVEYDTTENSDGSKTLTVYGESYSGAYLKGIVTFNQDGSFTEVEKVRED